MISVITPAFNSERTLQRAYESLAAQSMHDWEQIIVDDGSADSTGNIARRIAAEDARVKLVQTLNHGPGAALNRGIAEAQGEFVAFLDADDEYLSGHLERRVAFFQLNPATDLLWGGVDVVVRNPEDAYVPDVVNGAGHIHISECVVQGTLFVRRRVFEQVLFTEDRSIWYQDFDLVRRAGELFTTARFFEATYRYYRDSGTSLVDRVKATWPMPAA